MFEEYSDFDLCASCSQGIGYVRDRKVWQHLTIRTCADPRPIDKTHLDTQTEQTVIPVPDVPSSRSHFTDKDRAKLSNFNICVECRYSIGYSKDEGKWVHEFGDHGCKLKDRPQPWLPSTVDGYEETTKEPTRDDDGVIRLAGSGEKNDGKLRKAY